MGSVKDLKVINEPTEKNLGIGRFIFSDRYSVFDWGEMPDHIPDKGKAICIVTSYFFEQLESMEIKTHYLGIVENDEVKYLDDLASPSNTIEFKMVRVIKPKLVGDKYDYSAFKNLDRNFLIPLEVIYRNSLPEGSSLLKRLKSGEWSPQDVGLDHIPEPNTKLEKPIIDFSTKLEITDRYLREEEALQISGLTEKEFKNLKDVVSKINQLITDLTSPLGLQNEDGKVEFALDENRNLMVVDAVGALDECRFTYKGIPVSKEILRIFYRNTEWFLQVEEAKKIDRQNWKKLVNAEPPRLPQEYIELVSNVYKSYSNEITKRKFFEAPKLVELLYNIEEFTKS